MNSIELYERIKGDVKDHLRGSGSVDGDEIRRAIDQVIEFYDNRFYIPIANKLKWRVRLFEEMTAAANNVLVFYIF